MPHYVSRAAYLAVRLLASLAGARPTARDLRVMIDALKVDCGCEACGWTGHPMALHFAHIDSSTKYRTRLGRLVDIADMVKASASGFARYSVTVILAEIAKCRVLCANCHALETAGERGLAARGASHGVDICGDCGRVAVLADGVVCGPCDLRRGAPE